MPAPTISKRVTELKSALLAATFAVVALAPNEAAAAPQTVKENTLSVGSDLTYPPFVYMKDGKPAGFDVELMEGVAKQLGLAAEFKDTRFTSLITGARANHSSPTSRLARPCSC